MDFWVPVVQGGLQSVQAIRGGAASRLGGFQRESRHWGLGQVAFRVHTVQGDFQYPEDSGKVIISRPTLWGPTETTFWACDVWALMLSPFSLTSPVCGGTSFTT